MNPEDSLKTQQRKLKAYSMIRPIVEEYKDDKIALSTFVEVAWEFMLEHKQWLDIAYLIQEGMSHVALGLQKLTEVPPGPEAYKGMRLVIGWCSARQERPCGVCGKPNHSDSIGPVLYVDGSTETACNKCGLQYAPELLKLIQLLERNKQFVSVLDDLRKEHIRKTTRDF